MLTFRTWYRTTSLCVCSLPGQVTWSKYTAINIHIKIYGVYTDPEPCCSQPHRWSTTKRVIALCKAWGPRVKWTDSGRSPRVSCRECSITRCGKAAVCGFRCCCRDWAVKYRMGIFRHLVIALRFLVTSWVEEEAVKTLPNFRKIQLGFIFVDNIINFKVIFLSFHCFQVKFK